MSRQTDDFFASLRLGKFADATKILNENKTTFANEVESLQALILLYMGQLPPSPRTHLWEKFAGQIIRRWPAATKIIGIVARVYSDFFRFLGKSSQETYVIHHKRFMPGVVHYRYTNFLKGTIQSSWLIGLADSAREKQWSAYLHGYRGHCLCVLGRFDAGLTALHESLKLSTALATDERDQFRIKLFENLNLEIRTARAFHSGYAGLISEAKAYYSEVYLTLEKNPSFYIKALANSMRTSTSFEMLNRDWLREDSGALRKLFSGEKSQWWSLRAASYSALIESIDGNFDHANRMLQTCEHYYKSTSNRFELMRYHFVRSLIELESRSPHGACLHARKSRDFVQYIPGAQFHLSESIIHEAEVTTRALLFQIGNDVPHASLRRLKRKVKSAAGKVRGCKTLELKAKILLLLIDHLRGEHHISGSLSEEIRNECQQRSKRMLTVFNSFDNSGLGKSSQFAVNQTSHEVRDTAVIKRIAALTRETVSMAKVSELLCYLIGSDGAAYMGFVDANFRGSFSMREVENQNLVVQFRIDSSRALSFSIEQPNFQLGFDTYLETYMDLLGAIIRQAHNAEEQLRFKEMESKISLYSKVAHDIRSPISALNVYSSATSESDPEKRQILNAAIKRINEVASDLLNKRENLRRESEPEAELPRIYLPYILEAIVKEKLVEFQHRLEIKLVVEDNCETSAFVKCEPQKLKRVLSNLINNSVEADSSAVIVKLASFDGKIQLSVADRGLGMTAELVARLGPKPVTKGKSGGSGIGLSSAYEYLKSWNAKLQVESEIGVGSIISLIFPACATPAWFTPMSFINAHTDFVLVDDDASQAQAWKSYLSTSLPKAKLEYFASGLLVNEAGLAHASDRRLFLVDYNFNEAETGIDFVLKHDLVEHAVIVTDNYDDPNVINECQTHRIRLFPKNALAGGSLARKSYRKQKQTIESEAVV